MKQITREQITAVTEELNTLNNYNNAITFLERFYPGAIALKYYLEGESDDEGGMYYRVYSVSATYPDNFEFPPIPAEFDNPHDGVLYDVEDYWTDEDLLMERFPGEWRSKKSEDIGYEDARYNLPHDKDDGTRYEIAKPPKLKYWPLYIEE